MEDLNLHYLTPIYQLDDNCFTKQVEDLYIQRRQVEARYNTLNQEIYKQMGLELNYLRNKEKKIKEKFANFDDWKDWYTYRTRMDRNTDPEAILLLQIQDRIHDLQMKLHCWRRPDFQIC